MEAGHPSPAPRRRCDFAELARTVSGTFALGNHSIHGPSHWRRVERNGLWLAERSGGDLFVVRLFAWFHDSRRVNEWTDPIRSCAPRHLPPQWIFSQS
jgi:HD superfamily phosphodiesterase